MYRTRDVIAQAKASPTSRQQLSMFYALLGGDMMAYALISTRKLASAGCVLLPLISTTATANEPPSATYSKCLSDFAQAWCSVGASVDLLKRSYEEDCKTERASYAAGMIAEYTNEGKMTLKQISTVVMKVIETTEGWHIQEYERCVGLSNH